MTTPAPAPAELTISCGCVYEDGVRVQVCPAHHPDRPRRGVR